MLVAPSHLANVAAQVDAADVMMLAEFGPAQAGEEAFSLIGAGIFRAVGQRVVDHLDRELGAELFPTLGFVGMDGAALLDARLDKVHRSVFQLEHGSQGTTVPLTE